MNSKARGTRALLRSYSERRVLFIGSNPITVAKLKYMDLQKRLSILEEQLKFQLDFKLICNGNDCSINYSNEDFERENMIIRKITETKDWINVKNKESNNNANT